MRRLVFLPVVVLTLALLSTTAAFAQDAPPIHDDGNIVFCGQLAEADCALLTASQTALWDVTSGETAMTVVVYLDGFGRLPAEGPSVVFNNRSMFVAEPAVIDSMLALQEADPAAVLADRGNLAETLLLPLNIDTASTTIVSLSPELREFLGGLVRQDVPEEIEFETRLVDGVIYFSTERLARIAPQVASLGEWVGIDLMAVVPQANESRIDAGEVEPDQLDDAMRPPGMDTLAQPYLVNVAPEDYDAFSAFLEILPLRDAVVDDQLVAVYRMRMDVPAYLGSPAFQARVPGLTQSINTLLPSSMQDSERNVAAGIVQSVTSALMSNSQALVVQGIGYDNAYLYAIDMRLGVNVGSRTVNVDVQAGNANMNNIESIPPPANAFVVPLRLIMGLIETFGSGQ